MLAGILIHHKVANTYTLSMLLVYFNNFIII